MLDLIKKIVIFAIGFYFVLFFARTFLGGVSATGFAKDLTGALSEFRKLGQMGSSTNSGWGSFSANGTQGAGGQTLSSKGSDGAVIFVNLSRGNMVAPGQNILGNMRSDWFYEGVATARFLDEYGKQIGMTQVIAESNTNVKTQVPFSLVARFAQGGAQTGYLVIEKANTTGDKTKDAWISMPITYPVAASYNQTGGANNAQTNTSGAWVPGTSQWGTAANTNTTAGTGANVTQTTNTNTNTNTTGSNFGGSTLPSPR